jgi:hypothetical protein
LYFERHQFNCDSLDIVMFVSVTRDDLRDEFIMADEAFALSPISARAAQPREEDYEAISEAFMETSRGRWFLGEYARRNRNADTRMVLDAVARIEESLGAQKHSASETGLAEALAAIRSAADEARAQASAALDGLALDHALAPVRKGARVIREIAWRLREIGADGRICDLIDSQVSAIEAGCGRISSSGASAGLSSAFDLLAERIAAFDDSDASNPPSAEDTFPSPSPAPSDEAPAATVDNMQPAIGTGEAEPTPSPALPEQAVVAAAEVADVPAEAAADAHDEAVLDMVALEMAASDPSDSDDAFDVNYPSGIDRYDIHAEATPAASEMIATAPEPMAVPEPPAASTPAPEIQPAVRISSVQSSSAPSSPVQFSPAQTFTQSSPEPAPEPSLGATLIANGIVRGRRASMPDPLAPIRRMSQAEKIALFS